MTTSDHPHSFDRLAENYDRLAELGDNEFAHWLPTALPGHAESAADLGCGTGRHALLLADRFDRVLAVDLSGPMIDLAKRKRPAQNITYRTGDLMSVTDDFDLVLSVATLHHVPDIEATLAHIATIVRPGGTAILADLISRRGRVPRWMSKAGAYLQLFRDLIGRRPHTVERYRLAMHPAWLDHLASDRYLSGDEFDRVYMAALPGAETRMVGFHRVCIWRRPIH